MWLGFRNQRLVVLSQLVARCVKLTKLCWVFVTAALEWNHSRSFTIMSIWLFATHFLHASRRKQPNNIWNTKRMRLIETIPPNKCSRRCQATCAHCRLVGQRFGYPCRLTRIQTTERLLALAMNVECHGLSHENPVRSSLTSSNRPHSPLSWQRTLGASRSQVLQFGAVGHPADTA